MGSDGGFARRGIRAVISALLEFVQQVSRSRGKPLPQSGANAERGGAGRRRRARPVLGYGARPLLWARAGAGAGVCLPHSMAASAQPAVPPALSAEQAKGECGRFRLPGGRPA